MTLTPRIESAGKEIYTSLDDLKAVVTASQDSGEVVFDAKGRMLTTGHKAVPGGEVLYHLVYKLTDAGVELTASVNGEGPAPMRFILPVIARSDERFEQADARTLRIAKSAGVLTVSTDAAQGFETVPKERTFNLVPGFEAIPLAVVLVSGKETRVRLKVG